MAMIAARSAGDTLVLSTTTSRPAESAARRSASCRTCLLRTLGSASLLMCSCEEKRSRENVDFPAPGSPTRITTSGRTPRWYSGQAPRRHSGQPPRYDSPLVDEAVPPEASQDGGLEIGFRRRRGQVDVGVGDRVEQRADQLR